MSKLLVPLFCLMILIVSMGCSNGSSPNPVIPTNNDQDQIAAPLLPTDSSSNSSNDGPGNPVIPEEGITVRLEAHPSFTGLGYVGYPTKFRATAWDKNGEIIGFYGDEFEPLDSESFAWEGASSGILTPTSVGEVIVVSTTYKGVRSQEIAVEVIEPQIAQIELDPYWPITMQLGDILSPFTVRIVDIGGGLISVDSTRVTWIGGPNQDGIFQPTEPGMYEVYVKAANGIESEHMVLTVLEPSS